MGSGLVTFLEYFYSGSITVEKAIPYVHTPLKSPRIHQVCMSIL